MTDGNPDVYCDLVMVTVITYGIINSHVKSKLFRSVR